MQVLIRKKTKTSYSFLQTYFKKQVIFRGKPLITNAVTFLFIPV